jgi:hypothetical protein
MITILGLHAANLKRVNRERVNSSLSDCCKVIGKGVGGHVVDQARGADIVEGLA